MEIAIQQERQKIDEIDRQLRLLLNERAKVAQKIGKLKGGSAVYRPEREAQVLRKAIQDNQGPLTDPMIFRIQREIMSACLSLEKPLKIGYNQTEFQALWGLKNQFGSFAIPYALTDLGKKLKELADAQVDYLFLHERDLPELLREDSCFVFQGEWRSEVRGEVFYVIGHDENLPSGQDKTVCVVAEEFDFGSVPTSVLSKKMLDKEKLLLVEIQGHREEEPLQQWLEAEKNVRVLGSYPFFEELLLP